MAYICDIAEIDHHILSYLDDVELFQKIYFLNKYYYNFVRNSPNYNSAKKIVESTKTISIITGRLFIYICGAGLINIAKRLEHNPKIYKRYNVAFVSSCIDGHLDVAKWLYSR